MCYRQISIFCENIFHEVLKRTTSHIKDFRKVNSFRKKKTRKLWWCVQNIKWSLLSIHFNSRQMHESNYSKYGIYFYSRYIYKNIQFFEKFIKKFYYRAQSHIKEYRITKSEYLNSQYTFKMIYYEIVFITLSFVNELRHVHYKITTNASNLAYKTVAVRRIIFIYLIILRYFYKTSSEWIFDTHINNSKN